MKYEDEKCDYEAQIRSSTRPGEHINLFEPMTSDSRNKFTKVNNQVKRKYYLKSEFDKTSLSTKPGKVTVVMDNPSDVPHAIEVEGQGDTSKVFGLAGAIAVPP